MDSEQKGQGRHSLLATTELLHVTKTLHGRHSIEFQSTAVRLLCVIEAQVCLPTQRMLAAARHVSVDRLQSFVNVVEGSTEKLDTLGFDSLEFLSSFSSSLFGLFVVNVTLLQALRRRSESLTSLSSYTVE